MKYSIQLVKRKWFIHIGKRIVLQREENVPIMGGESRLSKVKMTPQKQKASKTLQKVKKPLAGMLKKTAQSPIESPSEGENKEKVEGNSKIEKVLESSKITDKYVLRFLKRNIRQKSNYSASQSAIQDYLQVKGYLGKKNQSTIFNAPIQLVYKVLKKEAESERGGGMQPEGGGVKIIDISSSAETVLHETVAGTTPKEYGKEEGKDR